MEKVVRLTEFPVKNFTNIERIQHFNSMLELDKFSMVVLIGLAIILILGLATHFMFLARRNAKVIGRLIVTSFILTFVVVVNISETYLPENNYDLYIRDYEDGDTLYKDLDNTSDTYLYRDEYYKVNGITLEELEENTIQFDVYK